MDHVGPRPSAALAMVLLLAMAGTAMAQEPPPPAPRPSVVGRVSAIEGRHLVIDLGLDDGVRPRDGIEIATQGGSVVTRALNVEAHQLRVLRPFGVEIPVGSAARPTAAAPTVGRAVPARPSYFGIEGRFFGFISANEVRGGGLLGEVRARYRAAVPLALQFRLSPIGVGLGEGSSIGVGHGELGLSVDLRVFELGATLGATLVEVEDDDIFGYSLSVGLSSGVFMRVGARDGFHVEIGMTYSYTINGFEWVLARFDAAIPFTFGRWLVFTASGGRTRHGMGAIGLRFLLRGSGGPGSLFLTPYVGGAGIVQPSASFGSSNRYAGFLLGIGVERRY